jgi:hypothetical protein
VEKIAAALPKRMFPVGSKLPARGRLPVNLGLYGLPRHRSAHLREADEYDAKADVSVWMSAFGGRADVACQELSGPFIAITGPKICLGVKQFSAVYAYGRSFIG